MRLAVLSDIHDQTDNLRAILTVLEPFQVDILLLCGDITQPQTLAQCRLPGVRLSFCLGNCDHGRAERLLEAGTMMGANGFSGLGRLSVPEGGIAFCHFPAQARLAADSGLYQAVFYGHSHRPGIQRLALAGGSVLLANPGDVEGRHGRVSGLLYDSRDQSCVLIDA